MQHRTTRSPRERFGLLGKRVVGFVGFLRRWHRVDLVVEAMARAVVMPDLPNIREVVTHDVEAALFRENDVEHLADVLRRLLGDDALRTRLGEAARRRLVGGGFTWDRNAERVEEEFAALCRSKAAQARH